MRRINHCALILGLLTSVSVFAGVTDGDVTDGDVTAYRSVSLPQVIMFTNDPSHDPAGDTAPLGAGFLTGSTCYPTAGFVDVGLVCDGASGNPINTYTCTTGTTVTNASDTTWCLFSEAPRTGGKAWAVKYVSGLIPTNDGASIVRCEGTDFFRPDYGCSASLPSHISINGGYLQMDTLSGSPPLDHDCSETAHHGRIIVDDVTDILYICTFSGWKITMLISP